MQKESFLWLTITVITVGFSDSQAPAARTMHGHHIITVPAPPYPYRYPHRNQQRKHAAVHGRQRRLQQTAHAVNSQTEQKTPAWEKEEAMECGSSPPVCFLRPAPLPLPIYRGRHLSSYTMKAKRLPWEPLFRRFLNLLWQEVNADERVML